ncbi:MAG TPA: MFS transporter [Dissulfurispiraceae bacterium]|nr:MFS transporter [Dissulfurispiraceae bacterium]
MRNLNLKVLLLLSLGHCMTDIYQGALPAALPFLKDKLGLTYTTVGFILVASNLASSVVQPVFGYYSDRKEKPLLLPLGCLCAGVGFSLLSLPSGFALTLVLVLLSGLGIAAYHPEGFKTASYFTGEKVATGMSIFSVGGNLGFAFGPIASLFILKHYGISFLPAMIIPALVFIVLIAFFWKSISIPQRVATARKAGGAKSRKSAYISLSLIIAAVIMRSWTQFGLITYIPFYYIDYLKGDAVYAGKLISTFLLSGVFGTLIGARLADRWGHKQFLIASFAMSSAVLPLIFVAKGPALFAAFGALGFVLISTFAVTMAMSQKLLPHNIGMASGLTVGFAIGTGGIGVTLLGTIADAYGVPVALKLISLLPILGFLISLFIKYPSAYQEK